MAKGVVCDLGIQRVKALGQDGRSPSDGVQVVKADGVDVGELATQGGQHASLTSFRLGAGIGQLRGYRGPLHIYVSRISLKLFAYAPFIAIILASEWRLR